MTFNADYRGLGELLRSPEMQAAMHAKAQEIADAAIAIAPVGDPLTDKHSGDYKDSFRVASGVQHQTTSRAYGRVENVSEHAAAIEFGNHRTRTKTINAQHVLSRAIDAVRGSA